MFECEHEALCAIFVIVICLHLRRFRELTRVCFPEVTHLSGNQACS